MLIVAGKCRKHEILWIFWYAFALQRVGENSKHWEQQYQCLCNITQWIVKDYLSSFEVNFIIFSTIQNKQIRFFV